jgi:hypothetical protein
VVPPLPPVAVAHVFPSLDCCHRYDIPVPVLPLKVKVVLLPEHTADGAAATVPGVKEAITVICAVCTFVQLPMVIV